MKTRTWDLADDLGLDIVEVTRGMNGYPEGLYKAVAGFGYFEDAEEFAEEVKGEVVLLTKRDGHQLWGNNGRQYEPLKREKFIDEGSEVVFHKDLDFEEWSRKEVVSRIVGEGADLFEIRDMVAEMCEAYLDMGYMRENEIAIVDTGDYSFHIEDKYTTRVHDDDVTSYMIAVVDYENDDE